jgi:hypothetical protein
MEELSLKSMMNLFHNPDIASSDFFLFGWLKDQLTSRLVAEINELFDIVEEILGIFMIDTITSVFSN